MRQTSIPRTSIRQP